MHIRHKILAWYLSVFLVFSILGTLALLSMHRMQQSYSNLINHRVLMVSETKDLMLAVEYEALMLRTYLLTGREEYEAEFRRQVDRVHASLVELEKGLTSDEEKVLFANLRRTVNGFTDVYAQSIVAVRERPGLSDQEKLAEVIRLTMAQRGTVRGVIAQGEDFIDYQQKLMDRAVAANAARVRRIENLFTAFGILSLLFGIAAALYISRTISDPVRKIEEQVNRIARGDLTPQELEVASRDEVGQLARSFATMLANLRELTERIQTKAGETGHFATDLRRKAQEAARSSGEATAVLSRTVATIADLNDRAGALAGVSERTSAQAENIKETTSHVLNQMESTARVAARASQAVRDLSAALTDVRQTVEFISQFADQADLLSRKAAEELTAESGGGQEGVFADLVREIRVRAQEAARSTKDVMDLIVSVQEHTREVISSVDEDRRLIGQGRAATKDATEAFIGLVEEIRAVTDRIQETVEASRDFSIALEGVTSASEAQTALIEGVAQACAMLDNLAKDLGETLATLKL
ncbi:MAG: methyl-accepting chemotaxis protein [Ammonifex sp.]|jgi:methyl-accepting chemotaxis protein|nr:MAG: methyl-accepting chemotaxis protein [Ammonifex sp.]